MIRQRIWKSASGAHLTPAVGLVLIGLLLSAPSVRAQQDDDDKDDPVARPVPMQPGFNDAQFDQWVFQQNNFGTRGSARERLESFLLLHLDDIDRSCNLTAAQRQKLNLAGRGDIKRFYVLYDRAKQKFHDLKDNQQNFQQIWAEINPLQLMLSVGMFGADSLLQKSLSHTLTPEQSARYRAVLRERQAFQHRAQIEIALLMIEHSAPLRDAQRRELIRRLEELTKPIRTTSQYGTYVLMYQMSQLPEEKLRPLFDDQQWKAFSSLILQYRGMRQWIQNQGLLSEPDNEDDDLDGNPAVKTDTKEIRGK